MRVNARRLGGPERSLLAAARHAFSERGIQNNRAEGRGDHTRSAGGVPLRGHKGSSKGSEQDAAQATCTLAACARRVALSLPPLLCPLCGGDECTQTTRWLRLEPDASSEFQRPARLRPPSKPKANAPSSLASAKALRGTSPLALPSTAAVVRMVARRSLVKASFLGASLTILP